MPSRLVESKRRYLITAYVGSDSGFIGQLRSRYWTWRINRMSEGEILERYYNLVG